MIFSSVGTVLILHFGTVPLCGILKPLDHGSGAPGKLSHADLELAKWVALVSMTADHYGKILAPEHLALTHLVGRLALPLFAWIVGTRLALSPDLGARYLRRLGVWAAVSQPVFVMAGRAWSEGNALLTLALGVAAVLAMQALAEGRKAAGGVALAATCAIAPFTEFGPLGVAAVPLTFLLERRRARLGAWAAGPLGLLANVRATVPPLATADTAALMATPFALLSLAVRPRLPRLPTHLFYAYYPAHLYVLHAIDVLGWGVS